MCHASLFTQQEIIDRLREQYRSFEGLKTQATGENGELRDGFYLTSAVAAQYCQRLSDVVTEYVNHRLNRLMDHARNGDIQPRNIEGFPAFDNVAQPERGFLRDYFAKVSRVATENQVTFSADLNGVPEITTLAFRAVRAATVALPDRDVALTPGDCLHAPLEDVIIAVVNGQLEPMHLRPHQFEGCRTHSMRAFLAGNLYTADARCRVVPDMMEGVDDGDPGAKLVGRVALLLRDEEMEFVRESQTLVPLWLGGYMHRRGRATIAIPDWLTVESIDAMYQVEQHPPADQLFGPLPTYFYETTSVLLEAMAARNPTQALGHLQSQVNTIVDMRKQKILQSILNLPAYQGYLVINALTPYEAAIFGDSLCRTLNQLLALAMAGASYSYDHILADATGPDVTFDPASLGRLFPSLMFRSVDAEGEDSEDPLATLQRALTAEHGAPFLLPHVGPLIMDEVRRLVAPELANDEEAAPQDDLGRLVAKMDRIRWWHVLRQYVAIRARKIERDPAMAAMLCHHADRYRAGQAGPRYMAKEEIVFCNWVKVGKARALRAVWGGDGLDELEKRVDERATTRLCRQLHHHVLIMLPPPDEVDDNDGPDAAPDRSVRIPISLAEDLQLRGDGDDVDTEIVMTEGQVAAVTWWDAAEAVLAGRVEVI